nr:PREDICTED: protein PML-like [Struthio camelus australis]
METSHQTGTSLCPPPSCPRAPEEEFQFVLCEGCKQESPNLKLLTCLHTLCLSCLSENKPIGQCPAAVWCSECEEFLCLACFEAHQWFFKKRSHEARKVEELRAETAHQFLEGTRKSCSLFCSSPGHTDQGHITSIYCKRCEKPLCCSCALLDNKHSQFYCDIRTEIQRRQEELGAMSLELKQRKSGFEDAYKALQDEVARLERVSSETREQIQQRVEQLGRGRLQALAERVMGRTGAASQAVPEVEVALENDLQEEPSQLRSQGIVPTFRISLEETQASTAPPAATRPKWRSHQVERGSQSSPKKLKVECDNAPARSNPILNQWNDKGGPSTSTPSQNCSSIPTTNACKSHADDTGVTSIIICSSEDSEEDTVVSSEPSTLLHSGSSTSHHSPGSASPWGYGPGLSTLVFFDLKVDQKTQQITQIAAANGDHTFKTLIQTPESVLMLLSQGVPLETAMEQLLWYLRSVPRPVLVVYNFWAPELPALFKALDATARKVDFCHTVEGYWNMLPIIKEKLPKAPSYKLKSLLRKHLRQQLNEGSALATAKALQDLGEALGLFSHPDPGPLFTHCNLQSYTILQALVQEKLLTKRAAKILARRNLILWELEQA